ncbi:MAG: hypothetical protein L7S56_07645 [Candidatus Poseidonia sp.]|nr:hypothetical protein [Poseidonia sp.]
MRIQPSALLLSMLMLCAPLAGCFGPDEGNQSADNDEGWFDFDVSLDGRTWYHYPGGLDAQNNTSALGGLNVPFFTQGTYYGTGFSTFEPTMGITSTNNLYFASYGNGPSGSTAVVQCSGMVEMVALSDFSCQNIYDPIFPVVNSNDPYIYVDPWTDRIMKFDMHALLGMTVEWSDNEGDSWAGPSVATGYSVQDHQTLSSSPYPALFHDTLWVFCINGNWPSPLCAASQDGGLTWGPELPGAPIDCQSGGLSAHMVGAENGHFYRGQRGCDGTGYSMYKTDDGALTWTEHVLPTEVSGTAETWNAEEAQVDADSESNVYAMWMGADDMPYFSYSLDEANTWSPAVMIAPAHLQGTGFPVIIAGDPGRVAFGYIGTETDGTWNGYMSIMTDAFNETPLITTVQINDPSDPLDNASPTCGYERCGGFGDFLDMQIDAYGRPWFSLSHNPSGDTGIYGALTDGPTLRGNLSALSTMPLGGAATL